MPMVVAQLVLIQEVQTSEFWQDISLPMLETIRHRLRALPKLIERGRQPLVFTDLEDRVGVPVEVSAQGISVGTDLDAFRRKARQFLRPHENHLAIIKLKRNEPLTPTDLSELERIFVEAGVDPQGMARLQEDGGLGLFVRSLVGLDREAAKRAFRPPPARARGPITQECCAGAPLCTPLRANPSHDPPFGPDALSNALQVIAHAKDGFHPDSPFP